MEKVTLKTRPPRQKDNISFNASLRTFDLPVLIKKMKREHAWANGGLNARILLKSPFKQIVLTALHEETVIESFQSNDSITVQIIEGKLKFHTRKESVILEKGQLLTLHEKIEYSLTAKEDTVLLLTVANGVLKSSEN